MKDKSGLSPRLQTQAENALFAAVLALQDARECRNFFRDLCTPAELQAMADRWQVVKPIADGEPYRSIHDRTGVSVTTIGRVARCLTDGHGGYQQVLARLHGGEGE